MPQVKRGSRGAGLHVPGVYQALLDHIRARYERRGREALVVDGREVGRKSSAGVDEHGNDKFFLYHRPGVLDCLEVGGQVVMNPGHLEDALWSRDRQQNPSAPRPSRLFGRGVKFVRVSSDDRVIPVADRGDGAGWRL
jgi:hypothetical protein